MPNFNPLTEFGGRNALKQIQKKENRNTRSKKLHFWAVRGRNPSEKSKLPKSKSRILTKSIYQIPPFQFNLEEILGWNSLFSRSNMEETPHISPPN